MGFTTAEGCFLIEVDKSSKYQIGLNIRLIFQVTQHTRDKKLLKSFISYFECGRLETKMAGKTSWCNFCVTKISDNYEKIIPFFRKHHQILGVKFLDFND